MCRCRRHHLKRTRRHGCRRSRSRRLAGCASLGRAWLCRVRDRWCVQSPVRQQGPGCLVLPVLPLALGRRRLDVVRPVNNGRWDLRPVGGWRPGALVAGAAVVRVACGCCGCCGCCGYCGQANSGTVHTSAAARALSGGAGSHSAVGPVGNAAAGAGRPSTTAQGSAAPAASVSRAPAPRQAFSPAPHSNDATPTPAARRLAPSYTRPMPATQKVTPPASVQETLRSIAENAALRWTDIAGVSLARSTGSENAKVTSAPNAAPSFEAERPSCRCAANGCG